MCIGDVPRQRYVHRLRADHRGHQEHGCRGHILLPEYGVLLSKIKHVLTVKVKEARFVPDAPSPGTRDTILKYKQICLLGGSERLGSVKNHVRFRSTDDHIFVDDHFSDVIQ